MKRRDFVNTCGLGAIVSASMMNEAFSASPSGARKSTASSTVDSPQTQSPRWTNGSARAKRVIYLFMAGGPSQIDLFDPKPVTLGMFDKDLPSSIRNGQRVTNMTAGQSRFPIAPSIFRFSKHGQSGAEVSELLPHLSSVVDEIAFVKSVHTDAINHDPAKTILCTGSQLPGMASIGAWVSYGIGGLNENLPNYIVLNCAKWSGKVNVQGLYSRLWGSGSLPAKHQGITFQPTGTPVLFLDNPPGVNRSVRRRMLDLTRDLNQHHLQAIGDPQIATTIAQQEMAYRMQDSVPELTDLSQEPDHVRALYGPEVDEPGTFAHNCLLARRMVEKDVRFVQIFHRGWDHHGNLPSNLRGQCGDIDEACKGLILDLKQRGLLDETLIVWGGEFGRTIFCQGKLTQNNYGRDHHPRCTTMWMAGGGIKGGVSYGKTDDFSYNVTENPVHVRDINATILHQLGIDHNLLSFPSNGLETRLTGVEEAFVVKDILA
ncbi:Protein of unknown function [Neorhodopirellula lusitana]|uniref:Sulfatase n=1 Tax=Neorhodopirellula lusitana TaxID=445327 RepID=A0ABY1PW89_9BACT|nr:DUF1501 domain-containing protein [Neorhodopirellula lusitana]SMP51054.1 Protein of unknown function [Neorhodopirellula lusitana]